MLLKRKIFGNWSTLFSRTYEYWYISILELNRDENLFDDIKEMGFVLFEAMELIETIIYKLTLQISELNSRPTPKYYDDPDDPPVERCPPFSFVECPNYHTCSKTITFNLKYMLRNINKEIPYIKKALEETPDLPMNEYK
jgi:hypothetical protein